MDLFQTFFKLWLLFGFWLTASTFAEKDVSTSQPANILMIMMDDLGRSDIGIYGAEWDTPNLDSFLSSSLSLSRHYIGYVCSASRSQFLTGRYSFHNGYGTLDVFDIEKIGHIPLQTPTFAEYLKEYTNYITYGIGKWQLGNPTYNNMALSRGFDYFWGYNGGKQDYFTKYTGVAVSSTTEYVDFWDNNDISNDWSNDYSTNQYFDKLTEIIDNHATSYNENSKDDYKPFFIYAALQSVHGPFPDYSENEDKMTSYYKTCQDSYNNKFNDFSDRISICEGMLGVDEQFGQLMKHFESTDELKAIWDNTIILFTSDNGGDLDKGSCNYPLRGGKNTFYDGNVRVLAAVGGGLLPESQQGKELEGLVSNVDWVPTLLTFAGVISSSQSMITFDNSENNEDYKSLDGYNMYDYIMYGSDSNSDDSDSDSDSDASTLNLNERDHILFHLSPSLNSNTNEFTKDISKYTLSDMDEIAIIFYDDDGTLWKYMDVAVSTNIIGDPTVNSGWCVEQTDGTDSDDTYTLMPNVGVTVEATTALYEISKDSSEKLNYVETDIETAAKRQSSLKAIKDIIDEKISYYVSTNRNAMYLYGSFYCFLDYSSHSDDAMTAAEKYSAWIPFVDNNNDLASLIKSDCNLNENHNIYKLLTTSYTMPDTLEIGDSTINEANKNEIMGLNNRVPHASKSESMYMQSNNNFVQEYGISASIKQLLLIGGGIGIVSLLMYFVFAHFIGDKTKEIAATPAIKIRNSLQGYQPL